MQASERIFEHAYITKVLGISVPLQETVRMSPEFRQRVLQEQLLFEGWFSDFSKLGGDLKNAFLTFRFIIEDPGRIEDFVGECSDKLEERIGKIFEWIDSLEEKLDRLGDMFRSKLEKPIEFIIAIKDRCEGVIDSVKSMSGWKKAVLAISSLVGISWLWQHIKKFGEDISEDISDFIEDFLADDVAERFNATTPLLATALYTDTSLHIFEAAELDEEAFKSDKFKKIKETLKNLITSIGMSAMKSLALDALMGALSGGLATAVKFLVKAFGGMKFVLRIMSQPLEKFTGKIKDTKAEMAEAEKGEDDPTDPDTKTEAYVRRRVRAALLASSY